MLKVIAIVLMLGAGPNGERDTYIFTVCRNVLHGYSNQFHRYIN